VARASPGAIEARAWGGEDEVVGRQSGLTDRAIEPIESGHVDLAGMGRLGQKGLGLHICLGQP
jgi:hypothetical protein